MCREDLSYSYTAARPRDNGYDIYLTPTGSSTVKTSTLVRIEEVPVRAEHVVQIKGKVEDGVIKWEGDGLAFCMKEKERYAVDLMLVAAQHAKVACGQCA